MGQVSTEMAKKVCLRFRELAPTVRGGITQPRTNFFGQLCMRYALYFPFVLGRGVSLKSCQHRRCCQVSQPLPCSLILSSFFTRRGVNHGKQQLRRIMNYARGEALFFTWKMHANIISRGRGLNLKGTKLYQNNVQISGVNGSAG